MIVVSGFLIRFLFFWFKVICACLFVIILQVQVGPDKSLEEWIEYGLRNSAVSRYLRGSATAGARVLNKKFPRLKGLTKSKIVKKNSVMEFHSGLLRQAEEAFDNYGIDENQRRPSSK
jgi:hypothetical protein